jgi:hypothetical protein
MKNFSKDFDKDFILLDDAANSKSHAVNRYGQIYVRTEFIDSIYFLDNNPDYIEKYDSHAFDNLIEESSAEMKKSFGLYMPLDPNTFSINGTIFIMKMNFYYKMPLKIRNDVTFPYDKLGLIVLRTEDEEKQFGLALHEYPSKLDTHIHQGAKGLISAFSNAKNGSLFKEARKMMRIEYMNADMKIPMKINGASYLFPSVMHYIAACRHIYVFEIYETNHDMKKTVYNLYASGEASRFRSFETINKYQLNLLIGKGLTKDEINQKKEKFGRNVETWDNLNYSKALFKGSKAKYAVDYFKKVLEQTRGYALASLYLYPYEADTEDVFIRNWELEFIRDNPLGKSEEALEYRSSILLKRSDDILRFDEEGKIDEATTDQLIIETQLMLQIDQFTQSNEKVIYNEISDLSDSSDDEENASDDERGMDPKIATYYKVSKEDDKKLPFAKPYTDNNYVEKKVKAYFAKDTKEVDINEKDEDDEEGKEIENQDDIDFIDNDIILSKKAEDETRTRLMKFKKKLSDNLSVKDAIDAEFVGNSIAEKIAHAKSLQTKKARANAPFFISVLKNMDQNLITHENMMKVSKLVLDKQNNDNIKRSKQGIKSFREHERTLYEEMEELKKNISAKANTLVEPDEEELDYSPPIKPINNLTQKKKDVKTIPIKNEQVNWGDNNWKLKTKKNKEENEEESKPIPKQAPIYQNPKQGIMSINKNQIDEGYNFQHTEKKFGESLPLLTQSSIKPDKHIYTNLNSVVKPFQEEVASVSGSEEEIEFVEPNKQGLKIIPSQQQQKRLQEFVVPASSTKKQPEKQPEKQTIEPISISDNEEDTVSVPDNDAFSVADSD